MLPQLSTTRADYPPKKILRAGITVVDQLANPDSNAYGVISLCIVGALFFFFCGAFRQTRRSLFHVIDFGLAKDPYDVAALLRSAKSVSTGVSKVQISG